MEFRILGPLEVLENGAAIDLGGQKQRALLAALVLHANEVVSTDRLIDALWDEDPPDTAQKALQVYVSQLRKLVGRERLQTKASGYLLRIDDEELDLTRFTLLAEEGKAREALRLWRGPALADFAYSRFAQPEIARLEALRLSALEERIEQDLARSRHASLAGELESLVAEHPLRERLRGQLMLALYRSGRQADALEAYQDARRALTEELGIEPGRELRELQQAILNQDPALDVVAGAPSLEPTRGVFVGRERELEELSTGLDEAFAGRGALFLLVGEPGIGKSRLAEELISRARARAARVLIGRCWEAGGAPAYWPWLQSLRSYVRETDAETLRAQLGPGAADLAQLLPELRDLLPGLPEPPALESESARFRLFEAASSFLRSASQARPLVIVLDDLHAADEPSLLLLRFLARELAESRLLVVAAYRDVDPTPTSPLTAALTELAREPATRSLPLVGLDESDVGVFIELISGEEPNNELVTAIYEETEGNPLFVGEIVRLLATERGLGAADARRLAIPQSVRDVIARRIRHLSEESNRLLPLASVLGREFGLDALARVATVSQDELLETLDEPMAARVVSEVPGSPGRLRFAHVLIRDTLYEGLTTARRVRLHRLVLEALEALYGEEPGAHLAELAHHAIAGSVFDKGLVYARRAADRALALLAYEEAARLYEIALDALELSDVADEGTKCALLLSLGEAEACAGNTPVAKETFLEAAGMARRLQLPRELARAAAGYGGSIVWARAGADERLVPLLEEGLAALGDDDVELRARLLARLAGALRDDPSRDRRDALSREAIALARRAENPSALAYALDGRAAAIGAHDTTAELLAVGGEACQVADRIGDRERIVYGHFHRFVAHAFLGDVEQAEHELAAKRRVAEELRQPALSWFVSAPRAMLALGQGKLPEGEELMQQALELGERAVGELANTAYRFQRYTLCEFRGQLDEIEPTVRASLTEYPNRPFRYLLPHLRARLGDLEEARGLFDELARDAFAAVSFDLEWLLSMSLLAETCTILKDRSSAESLYGLLLPYAGLNVVDPPEAMRGSVARYLGLLTALLERQDDAERHFEQALEMNERMDARPWFARTQEDYGRMLLGRGDEERGRILLDQALATYRELGMPSYAASAAAALTQTGA